METRTYQEPIPNGEWIDLDTVTNGDLIRMSIYWSDDESNLVNEDWMRNTGDHEDQFDDDPSGLPC